MNVMQDNILHQVVKPARYTGGEWNLRRKEHDQVEALVALAFPDVYEVGMSNLGYKILYQLLNERKDTAAERVYAPWVDMEDLMRRDHRILSSLENGTPLHEFDIVGFSLQYEMSYTNVLNMLDLGGISLLRDERGAGEPLVIVGGPCAFNPEPIADFCDAVVVGEGEAVLPAMLDIFVAWKKAGRPGGKTGLLAQWAKIQGVYVPEFYKVTYDGEGKVLSVTVNQELGIPETVSKGIVKDLDGCVSAERPLVPFLDIVHDRLMLELFRGCTRGCRFCQAGMIYRPVRERNKDTLLQLAKTMVENTGYDEISLVSLSSADYSCLRELVEDLLAVLAEEKVSLSLPSLRIDSFSIQLANEIQKVRKSGLTFAPEAGTQRLRDVINKGVTAEDLATAAEAAFRAGWSNIKLYFMMGLPTETDEDIAGIAEMARQVSDLYRKVKGRRGAKITVSVSSFVPKPMTPFQWFGQNSIEEVMRKQQLLRSLIQDKSIVYNWHDAKLSYLEGVMARGDRRLGNVILSAWKKGARFDGWSEHFSYSRWMEAFQEQGIDPDFYTVRERAVSEHLPWDHLSCGVEKEYLRRENDNACKAVLTGDCRRGECTGCGVCPSLDVEIVDGERGAQHG